MMLLPTPAFTCAEGVLATTHMAILQRGIAQNPKTVVTNMLATLSTAQLKVVVDGVNSNNFEHKMDTLAKVVFAHDFETAAHKVNAMEKMKGALKSVTCLAFTTQFYNGSFDWDGYKEAVYDAAKLRAQADIAPVGAGLGGLGV